VTEDKLDGADAARLLGVPLAALECWARQFGFPTDVSGGGLPRFPRGEIDALRATLGATHSVGGAIREARRQLNG
jgi:hypothetical protein